MDKQVEEYAKKCGLFVECSHPGDGKARYKFFILGSAGGGIKSVGKHLTTIVGKREAITFISGFEEGTRYQVEKYMALRAKINELV
jgi:hypothetical protein